MIKAPTDEWPHSGLSLLHVDERWLHLGKDTKDPLSTQIQCFDKRIPLQNWVDEKGVKSSQCQRHLWYIFFKEEKKDEKMKSIYIIHVWLSFNKRPLILHHSKLTDQLNILLWSTDDFRETTAHTSQKI